MAWHDYLPLLIPLVAAVAIVHALFFARRRPPEPARAHEIVSGNASDSQVMVSTRDMRATSMDPAGNDPAAALRRLEAGSRGEGPDPGLARINDWLRQVVERGDTGQLARLARIDPAFLHPLGNTPAHLHRAIERTEGELRASLTAQRDAVISMSADRQLLLWKQFIAGDPASIDPLDERFEALVTAELPGVLPTMFADLSEREADPDWRAVRLHLLGRLHEHHPDHPAGSDTLRWLTGGMNADHPRELAAAIEAFPNVAADHRFDPGEHEAAALRDRAIALAQTDLPLDAGVSEDLGEGLHELTGLTHVDRAPVEAAAGTLVDAAAAAAAPGDLWAEAERLKGRGVALLQDLPFARLAVDRHPRYALVAAAALMALEKAARRSRVRRRPDLAVEQISHDILRRAPAPVVARLAEALATEADLSADWSVRPGNMTILRKAWSRTDLPDDLIERLKALDLTVSGRYRQRWQEVTAALFDRFEGIASADWTSRNVSACAGQIAERFQLRQDSSAEEVWERLREAADRPFWRAVHLSSLAPAIHDGLHLQANELVRMVLAGMTDPEPRVREAAEGAWTALRTNFPAETAFRRDADAALAGIGGPTDVIARLRKDLAAD